MDIDIVLLTQRPKKSSLTVMSTTNGTSCIFTHVDLPVIRLQGEGPRNYPNTTSLYRCFSTPRQPADYLTIFRAR